MKLKSILSISSIFLLLAVLVSSCGSTLNITKKRHSSGYYVNIGSDTHNNTNKVEKNKRGSVSDLVENKINSNDFVANIEAGDNLANTDLKGNEDFKNNNLDADQVAAATEFSKMSTLKKIKALKNLKKQKKADDNEDIALLLLVILAIILPPVAVYLKKDITTPFWISILLTLLFWLPGVIYALLIVFDAI